MVPAEQFRTSHGPAGVGLCPALQQPALLHAIPSATNICFPVNVCDCRQCLQLPHHCMSPCSSVCFMLPAGDVDQLPPVGPGTVLADAIRSGVVPVIDLREIFRQAQQSAIVGAAHAILSGSLPSLLQRLQHVKPNSIQASPVQSRHGGPLTAVCCSERWEPSSIEADTVLVCRLVLCVILHGLVQWLEPSNTTSIAPAPCGVILLALCTCCADFLGSMSAGTALHPQSLLAPESAPALLQLQTVISRCKAEPFLSVAGAPRPGSSTGAGAE